MTKQRPEDLDETAKWEAEKAAGPAHYTHQRGHLMVGKPSKLLIYADAAIIAVALIEAVWKPSTLPVAVAVLAVGALLLWRDIANYRQRMRDYRTAHRIAARALPTSPGSTRAGGQPNG